MLVSFDIMSNSQAAQALRETLPRLHIHENQIKASSWLPALGDFPNNACLSSCSMAVGCQSQLYTTNRRKHILITLLGSEAFSILVPYPSFYASTETTGWVSLPTNFRASHGKQSLHPMVLGGRKLGLNRAAGEERYWYGDEDLFSCV